MTDAINNSGRIRTNPPLNSSTNSKSSPDSKAGNQEPTSSSIVDIKSTQILASMKDQLDKVSNIDSTKVDAIKLAISNGDYKPNPDVIAQKFMDIEKLL